MPINQNEPPKRMRFSRNVWAATITSGLVDISTEMIAHLIPLFLANVLGVSTAVIGLIEGIAETTSSVMKGVSGWLSDRLYTRKWLAVAGYAISAIAKPFLALAANATGVLIIRFAERLGKGIRTSPRDALIADSIEPERRGAAFGFHRAGDTLGAFIGVGIALVVVLATQAQAVELSDGTFKTLVWISVIPAVLGVIVLVVGAREVRIKPADASAQARSGRLSRDFRYYLIIIALFTLGNSSDAFLILRAQERGLSVAGVLAMLLTFNLIYALLSVPLGRLSDRIGRKRLLIGGWLVYAVLYLGFALSTTAAHIWILYALYGVYYAATEGTGKALVADLIIPDQRGTAYGAYNATVGLMALPASVLAGILWQGIGAWTGFGASAPFIAGAGFALAAAFLMSRWRVMTTTIE